MERDKRKTGKTINMTEGKPLTILLRFAFPIFLSMVLQSLYNLMDTAIAGYILGDNALAAIGATGAVYNLLVTFASGLNTGFSMHISRAFGSGDRKKLEMAVTWICLLNLVMAVVFTAGSLLFVDQILIAMNTPQEIYADAKDYLFLILAGIPVTMAYNMGSAVLRSMGNSATPLNVLLISSGLNVVMNYVFAKIFQWGVAGLAIATILAQGISAAYTIWYVTHNYGIRIQKAYFHPEKGFVSDMFLTGLSMGMMGLIVSVGSVILQSAVNDLGSGYIAGQIGGSKVQVVFTRMIVSVANAVATYISQNYGAGRRDRVRQGLAATFLICSVLCIVCIAFALSPMAPLALHLITGSQKQEVLESGARFIRVTLQSSPFLCTLLVLRNTLQGMGHKVVPLFASAVEMLGKVLFAWTMVPRYGYPAVCVCEPVLWVVCSCYLAVMVFLFRKEFTV